MSSSPLPFNGLYPNPCITKQEKDALFASKYTGMSIDEDYYYDRDTQSWQPVSECWITHDELRALVKNKENYQKMQESVRLLESSLVTFLSALTFIPFGMTAEEARRRLVHDLEALRETRAKLTGK